MPTLPQALLTDRAQLMARLSTSKRYDIAVVGGGATGVGRAVNETLVLCVVALFAVNVIFTTIGVRFGTGR